MIGYRNLNYEQVEALYKNQTLFKLSSLNKSFKENLGKNSSINALKNLNYTACLLLARNVDHKSGHKNKTKEHDACITS